MATYDIIIIGGGHNGLVAAGYLAKAGLKTLVLERREVVGGGAVTEEIHPGFRCSTLAHAAGPLFPDVVKDLKLAHHGLETINPDVRVLALDRNGRSLAIYDDATRTACRPGKDFVPATPRAIRNSRPASVGSDKSSLLCSG